MQSTTCSWRLPGWRDLQTTVRDGSVLDIAWASVRLSYGTGIGIGHVVSERKLLEAIITKAQAMAEARNIRLELAMRESTHRFKNDLQMISALIDVQAQEGAAAVPREQLAQVEFHIQALGEIQAILLEDVRHNSREADLSANTALLRLVPLLKSTLGVKRIEFVADDVRLPVKQGMCLAVLVNELVCNASKHGGEIIYLQLTVADGDVPRAVSDDGPGFVLPLISKEGTHGIELVETLSRVDLSGTVTFDNRPEGGGRVRIRFPAPASIAA